MSERIHVEKRMGTTLSIGDLTAQDLQDCVVVTQMSEQGRQADNNTYPERNTDHSLFLAFVSSSRIFFILPSL